MACKLVSLNFGKHDLCKDVDRIPNGDTAPLATHFNHSVRALRLLSTNHWQILRDASNELLNRH